MARIQAVKPVKLFIGMLAGDASIFDLAAGKCAREFGEVESRGEILPFDHTDYYLEEMGPGLLRQFVTFQDLIDPARLPEIKVKTNELERQVAEETKSAVARPVNLDPGYVSSSGVFLATAKNYSHRIYLGLGIYCEVTLHFHQGSFQPWPWTYADYRTPAYVQFFNEVRARYMQQLKWEGIGTGTGFA
jgi:hypothetical protein